MGLVSSRLAQARDESLQSMLQNQRTLMLRQRETQMAVQMARSRDLVLWLSTFTGTVAVLGAAAVYFKGKHAALVPVLPLSFVTAYNYDLAYGNKLNRIRAEADRILLNESDKFALPDHSLVVSPAEYKALLQR